LLIFTTQRLSELMLTRRWVLRSCNDFHADCACT